MNEYFIGAMAMLILIIASRIILAAIQFRKCLKMNRTLAKAHPELFSGLAPELVAAKTCRLRMLLQQSLKVI